MTSFSELALVSDYDEVQKLEEASAWNLQRPAPLEVLAWLRPATAPHETFLAVLRWSSYPDEPPSIRFRDPATGREDVSHAWPQARAFRPPSDICSNYTAEGFALHQEWRTDPTYRWQSQGNVLLKVLRIMERDLDETFGGRAP